MADKRCRADRHRAPAAFDQRPARPIPPATTSSPRDPAVGKGARWHSYRSNSEVILAIHILPIEARPTNFATSWYVGPHRASLAHAPRGADYASIASRGRDR